MRRLLIHVSDSYCDATKRAGTAWAIPDERGKNAKYIPEFTRVQDVLFGPKIMPHKKGCILIIVQRDFGAGE